jgi:hypothetical protein
MLRKQLLWILLTLQLPCLLTSSAEASEADRSQSVNAQLIDYYSKANNYRRVKREVLAWHKTTKNGCVAFASTALRHIGIDVPLRGKRDGWGVSRITFAFSGYLEEAGWTRNDSANELEPGDLVFTTGYPDHVFVFHSWRDARRQLARVLDNKGYLLNRPMFPDTQHQLSAFAYALRAPAARD